jgi:hypothetical protein
MYITSEPVLLSVIAGSTLVAAVRFRRRGARGRQFAGATLLGFSGATLTTMLAAHNAEIVYRLLGNPLDAMPPLKYDFRSYSLLLVGVLLMVQGGKVIRAAAAVSRGDAVAHRVALRAGLAVLAIGAPIIPIHIFFGPITTALAVLVLAGATLARPTNSIVERRPVPKMVPVVQGW